MDHKMDRKQILIDLGIVDADKPELSRLSLKILEQYNDEELERAVIYAVSNCHFDIKIADLIEYFIKVQKEQNKTRAEKFYTRLCASRTTYDDVVVDDPIAGKTVRALYGSVQRFNERPVEASNSDYALKLFVDRYIELALKFDEGGISVDDCYFPGKLSSCPRAEFIGNYGMCLWKAKAIYKGKNVKLPRDPDSKALPKPERAEETPLSKEESIKVMGELLSTLKRGKPND